MAQDNTIDPVVILTALEAKITALQALVASWKAAIAVGALGPVTDMPAFASAANGGAEQSISMELPKDAFRKMSLPAAIKLYLAATKRKQAAREIAAGLKDGGMESTSENFEGVVTGSLNRLKAAGEILRFKDGWDLAEHYSEQFRSRISKDANTKKTAAKGKKRSKQKAKKAVPKSESVRPKQGGTQEAIVQLLRSKPGAEYTAAELSSSVGVKIQVAHLLLGKLVAKKEAEKTTSGKFRAMAA